MSEDTKNDLSVIIVVGGQSTREMQEYFALERVLNGMQIPHQVIHRDHASRVEICDPRIHRIAEHKDGVISVCDPRVHVILGHENELNSLRILNHRPQDALSGIIGQLMKNSLDIQCLVECSRLHFTYQKGHNYPWYLAFSGQRVPKVLGRRSSFK